MAQDPRWDAGVGPDPKAVAFLEGKGLKRSWRWPSMWQTEHAYAFTLAGVYRLDVLAAAKQLVTEAVAEGQTLETFRAGFEDRLKKLGFAGPQNVGDFAEGPREVDLTAPWRGKVIYDTNVRQAYASAEWQAIEDTVGDFPALQYHHTPQAHPRQQHLAWDKLVLPVKHDFWKTNFPPNGWYCKCFTLQVSVDELASGAVKLSSEDRLAATGWVADPARWPEWRHAETGRVDRAPEGVTPGFAYNAGHDRRRNLQELLQRRVEALDPDMARAAAADLVNFPLFADLAREAVGLGEARAKAALAVVEKLKGGSATRAEISQAATYAADQVGTFPTIPSVVGVAPADIAAQALDGARVVVANASTIGHAADRHPTTPADWRKVQLLLERGEVRREASGDLALFGVFVGLDEKPVTWTLALKPVSAAWRVKTMFQSSPRTRARIAARSEQIREGGDPIQLMR